MGMLEGKSIAVTGAGRGIGRSVALACAAAGASVVVNDYGVSMDGSEPTSEPANEVVAEIKAAGGNAVANPSSVAEMAGGASIVEQACDEFGSIDGVVCVAGILREKMLFNMAEEEWDAVIATHLKGHFTLFRAASAVMRKQKSGSLVAFTSGAFAGSVAQANYSAAKGGIVSLTRSAAAGLNKYGVRANCIAPTAKTRMSENVPFAIADMGTADDIAPMAVYLLSDKSAHVTGQIYSVAGTKIAVWNQPEEVRSVYREGGWTAEEIATRLDSTVGQEKMGLLEKLAMYAKAAAAKTKPNA
jgi:NAD(P)-dependent dehydrogenase (short-subunit alcohol dehydrogenase family)